MTSNSGRMAGGSGGRWREGAAGMAAGGLVLCVIMVSISESPSSLLLAPLALPSKSDMNRWFVKGSGVDQMRQQATKDERIAEELGSKIHNEMSLLAGKADGSSSSIIARAELAATKAAIVAAAQRTQSKLNAKMQDEKGFLAGVNEDVKMRQLAQYLHLDKKRNSAAREQSQADSSAAVKDSDDSQDALRNVDPEVRQALRAVFHEILHKIDKYETTSSPKPSSSNSKVSDSASRSEARVDKAPKHISQPHTTHKEQVIAHQLEQRIDRLREKATAHRNAALLDLNEAAAIKRAATLKVSQVFRDERHAEQEVYL